MTPIQAARKIEARLRQKVKAAIGLRSQVYYARSRSVYYTLDMGVGVVRFSVVRIRFANHGPRDTPSVIYLRDYRVDGKQFQAQQAVEEVVADVGRFDFRAWENLWRKILPQFGRTTGDSYAAGEKFVRQMRAIERAQHEDLQTYPSTLTA